ncbi:hypothetical protein [Amycolatopsis suaedae]|uniref:Antitoxin Phd n=1 Tax=Amycolatopsis suaedae TaxID=2510978 RepID=A0A4Q7J0C4_9PSEU|nr:hypothetical protein [Amycolatopsis suaedae]RZQ60790.1 hypothetical protein EWH70_27175 [Amycolatopsis suaedae]
MPALNPQFSEEEMESIRVAAEGRSLKAFAHDAVVSAVSSREHLVEQAAARVAGISVELNERLAR